jgi:hypothetical protein
MGRKMIYLIFNSNGKANITSNTDLMGIDIRYDVESHQILVYGSLVKHKLRVKSLNFFPMIYGK